MAMETKPGAEQDLEAWALHHFDHKSAQILDDPYPIYKLLRDKCPVVHSDAHEDGFWAVSRYQDVKDVLLDTERFDAGKPSLSIPAFSRKLYPAEVNGERHVILRRILASVLDNDTVATMEDRLRRHVGRIIDGMVAMKECDVVEEMAVQIPTYALFHPPYLGAPLPILGDRWAETIRDWVLEFKFIPEKSAAAGDHIVAYLLALIEERRKAPQDDIPTRLGILIEAGEITNEEALAVAFSAVFGGIDTPASVIGFAMMHLAQHPDLKSALRDDVDLIPPVIDEVLRFYGPTQGLRRTANQDAYIGETRIPRGDSVLVMLNSASRDDREFERADAFIPNRRPNRHMGFGWGEHRCVGANAGRLMLRVTIEEVVSRAPDFHIKEGAKLEFLQSTGRTLRSLPIVFEAAG